VVTAAPQDQWRLLDVQDHDTRLAQLAHRARTLPEHAAVTALETRLREMADELVVARTTAGDIARELSKAEGDVELVRQRAVRDQARLDGGQGSAKDLQALQHEIASLAQRQSALEDVELEVMERLESAQAQVGTLETENARLEAELAEVVARRDAALAGIDDEIAAAQRARADAAAGLPADLLALYEKVRASSGGIGAARLRARKCEGCRMELNPTDIARIRSSAEDAVVRCEDCDRILVRTPESGL
jgi:predicted  nucleic acid-binding Zn-ribbon protein